MLLRILSGVFAFSAIVVALPQQVNAQYYGQYGNQPPQGYYGNRPPPPPQGNYGNQPPPGYYGNRPPQPQGNYGNRPPPRGSMCVTSRGSCPTFRAPNNTPCRCDLPGFGVKRGAVIN